MVGTEEDIQDIQFVKVGDLKKTPKRFLLMCWLRMKLNEHYKGCQKILIF